MQINEKVIAELKANEHEVVNSAELSHWFIFCTTGLDADLRRASEATGASVNSIIRVAVRSFLNS